MTNTNSGGLPNKKTSGILKRIALCIGIYMGYALANKLPLIIQVIIVFSVMVFWVSIKYGARLIQLRCRGEDKVARGKQAIARLSRVATAVMTMSDKEFNSRFNTAAPAPPPLLLPEYVPQQYCKPTLKSEDYYTKAMQWWEDGGMQRISEHLSMLAYDDPATHTSVLHECEELLLPDSQQVLEQLVKIMKENGLDADINADSQIIVYWNQYEDGLEAAQAHEAERKSDNDNVIII